MTPPRVRRVAVVGGGVSGLATAYRLTQADPSLEVHVFDAGPHVGGKLRSVAVGDLVLPAGADSFLARKPWALDLCKELGIADELMAPGTSGSYLWTDKGLVNFAKDAPFGIPGDVSDVFRWPGLSKAGRRRAAQDLVRGKRKEEGDETLGVLAASAAGRRGHRPRRRALAGGTLRGGHRPALGAGHVPGTGRVGAIAGEPGARVAGRHPQRPACRRRPAPCSCGHAAASSASPTPSRSAWAMCACIEARAWPGWHDSTTATGCGSPTDAEPVQADAVVLAPEAHVAAELLRAIARRAYPRTLGGIPYASTGVVLMVYGEGTARRTPSGHRLRRAARARRP